jgi:hypothetical protein
MDLNIRKLENKIVMHGSFRPIWLESKMYGISPALVSGMEWFCVDICLEGWNCSMFVAGWRNADDGITAPVSHHHCGTIL